MNYSLKASAIARMADLYQHDCVLPQDKIHTLYHPCTVVRTLLQDVTVDMYDALQIEERVSHYAVIVSKEEGLPLYLHMMGGEIVAHAHYDEYVMNFTSFKAVPSNDLSSFEVPAECQTEKALETMPSRPLSLALASLVPGVRCLTSPVSSCCHRALNFKAGSGATIPAQNSS